MTCPYCNKVMEEGIIQSSQELSWKKGIKRPIFGRAGFYEDSIVLSKLSLMKGSAVKALLCRKCMKVIIDYADKESDLNQC